MTQTLFRTSTNKRITKEIELYSAVIGGQKFCARHHQKPLTPLR